MKILIILPNNSLGGAEQFLKMIAAHHAKDDVRIFFLKKFEENDWSKLPKSISQQHFSTTSHVKGLLSLIAHLVGAKERKFDRIYTSHIYITAIMGMLISFGLLKKKEFVARESTSIFKRFNGFKLFSYKLAYKLGYRNIDLLICQTAFMKEQLIENLKEIEKRIKVVVLQNPIDYEVIKTMENKAVDYLPSQKFIVSAGRLIPEKGFDLLIEAFSKIKLDYPNLQLLILGEGPERESLIGLVEKYKITECVHLPGRVANVYPYFRQAGVCIVSSRIEGFPNVLLQMMSQNNHVISTTCAGGIEEIPGLKIIEPGDAKQITESIIDELNSSNSENRKTFDNYLKHRDISSFVPRLEQFLTNSH